MSEARDALYLVDASGFIFRAYHALPPLSRSDGLPVGAVLGFCNMLAKLLIDKKADRVAVVFDAARRNFRNDIFPAYKANRSETPEDLIPQFPYVRRAAQAFGLPVIEQEGYEADDLIAAYARSACAEGLGVVIVGSDKDLMQLVTPDIRMFDPVKDVWITSGDVEAKFGVPPEKVVDVQALAGDSTDNIPGVSGIGVKTAAELIRQYGDLETLLAHAADIPQPKRRAVLMEQAELARISRKLVTLDSSAPLPVPLHTITPPDPDFPLRSDFLEEMEFKGLLARFGHNKAGGVPSRIFSPLPSSPAAHQDAPERLSLEENVYTLITDMHTLEAWIASATNSGILAVDTETTDLTPSRADLCGISICSAVGHAAYIPIGHLKPDSGTGDLFAHTQDSGNGAQEAESSLAGLSRQLPLESVMRALRPVLEDERVLKVGHNFKFDLQMFSAHGIRPAPVDDTMLLSYVLDGTAHSHGMDSLARLYLAHETITYDSVTGTGKKRIGFAHVPLEKALPYAAEDADVTLRLHAVLKPRLAVEHMVSVYEDIERPLIPVIAEMERTGVRIDPAVLQGLSRDFSVKLSVLESTIHEMAGHSFNIGSPARVGTVLFEDMKLAGGKRTKTGQWGTPASLLEDLADQGHEIVGKILEWRQLSKLKSTYTDALLAQINPRTGRVHTSFSMALTNTGRLSSSDPNLQNIPVRTEEGRKIRAAFVAAPGWKILAADYSQVELRLAAAMAGISALKDAFVAGADIHALTAARVFGVAESAVTPELRRQAKAVNFGILYGISAWGLARQLGCEQGEAAALIRTYMEQFPEIRVFMESCKEEARAHGHVRTLFGRKCHIAGIHDKNAATRAFAERQAINAPIQGTAADILKKAMIRMPDALRDAGLQARMLLQVHDELVFEVPESQVEESQACIRAVMESTARIGVPLPAECGIADNWAAAH